MFPFFNESYANYYTFFFLITSLKNVFFIKIKNGHNTPPLGHFIFCYDMHYKCMSAWISDCREITWKPGVVGPGGPAVDTPEIVTGCGASKELYATICEKKKL